MGRCSGLLGGARGSGESGAAARGEIGGDGCGGDDPDMRGPPVRGREGGGLRLAAAPRGWAGWLGFGPVGWSASFFLFFLFFSFSVFYFKPLLNVFDSVLLQIFTEFFYNSDI